MAICFRVNRTCTNNLYFVGAEIQGQSKDNVRCEQYIQDKTMNHCNWRNGPFSELTTLFFPAIIALEMWDIFWMIVLFKSLISLFRMKSEFQF